MNSPVVSANLQKREVRIHTRPMTEEEYRYVLRMFANYFDQQDRESINGQSKSVEKNYDK